MSNFITGNFIIFTMSMLFIFSTAYTIVYYYNTDNEQATEEYLNDVEQTTNEAKTEKSIIESITQGFIDDILGFLAIINPFGLVIIAFKLILAQSPDVYTFLNLLFLRPIGWTGTLITSNYVISKIRGTGES